MGINWQEHSIKDYVSTNNLTKELKKILQSEGYFDETNSPFAGFKFEEIDQFVSSKYPSL